MVHVAGRRDRVAVPLVGVGLVFVGLAALLTLGQVLGDGALEVARWAQVAVPSLIFGAAFATTRALWTPIALPGRVLLAVVAAATAAALVVAAAVGWVGASTTYFGDRRVLHPLPVDGLAAIVAGSGSALVLAAASLGRRPRHGGTPTWLRLAFVGSAVLVVALGAWLPIVAEAELYPRNAVVAAMEVHDVAFGRLMALLVVPPVAVAVAAVAVATAARRWRWAAVAMRVGGWLLAAAVMTAVMCAASSHGVGHEERVLRDASPLLFAAAALCLAHAVALGVAQLRALATPAARPGPWRQVGTVEVDGPGAAVLSHDGWLTGTSITTTAFTLRTAAGPLRVPAGAGVVAPVPPAAMIAPVGTPVPLVPPGTEVTVDGFVDAGGADYRASGLPVPGTDGMVLRVARGPRDARAAEVAARLWRPCVAALVAIALAALPVLASLGDAGFEDDRIYLRDTD